MAATNPIIEEAAEEVYKCIQNDEIRLRIEARQDYERRQRTLLAQIAERDEQLAEMGGQIAEKDEEIAMLRRQLAELKGRSQT